MEDRWTGTFLLGSRQWVKDGLRQSKWRSKHQPSSSFSGVQSDPGGQAVNPPALIHPKSLPALLGLFSGLIPSCFQTSAALAEPHPSFRLQPRSCWRVLAQAGPDENLIPRIWKGFRTWKQRDGLKSYVVRKRNLSWYMHLQTQLGTVSIYFWISQWVPICWGGSGEWGESREES